MTLNRRERGHFDALHNAAVMGDVGEPALVHENSFWSKAAGANIRRF